MSRVLTVGGSGIDHRVVMASAGTGKTHRLTNRLITLLTRGVPASEIVATTFTRKAAGEILERVVERLVRATEDDGARASLAEAGASGPTRVQCLEAMRGLARHLDRVGVLTIDSFFQRMAGAMSMEAGGALRRIAEEAEDEAIRDEALARAVEEADRSEVSALVRVLFDGQPAAGVANRLRSAIEGGLLLLYETRAQPEVWSARTLDDTGDGDESAQIGAMRARVGGLRSAAAPVTAKGAADARWGRMVEGVIGAADAGDIERVLERLGGVEAKGSFHGKPVPERTLALIGEICVICRARLRARLHERTVATRALLERFERVYESLKAERGVWRFEDVPRALLSQIGGASLDRLYYHLDGRVRHLLLDEFQDTSMTAFRLLAPLIDEIVSAEAPERSLFCVGDTKQSLYVWNGAEPELLGAIAERWPQVRSESMGVSRRSSGAIMHAVNQVLGTMTGERLAGREGVASQWSSRFPRHEAHDAGLPGEVRVVVSTREDGKGTGAAADAASLAEADVRATVDRVRSLRERAPECTIGVLARTNTRVARVIHALRAAGVEASEEGAGSLLDSAPVAVLRSVFHLADHPSDSASAFHVATSPIGAGLGLESEGSATPSLSRVLRLSARIRGSIEAHGLSGAVLWIRSLAMGSMDDRDRDRFDAAVEVARAVEARGGSCASDLVRAIDAARVRSVSDSVVRVMTIHASKGLEFDAVILAECGWGMRGRARDILAERSHPLGPVERVVCRPPAVLAATDAEMGRVVDQARDRGLMESLCLLYVAMTRARHVFEAIVSGQSIRQAKESSTGIYPGRLIVEALRPDIMEAEGAGVFDVECVGVTSDWPAAVAARAARAKGEPSRAEVRELALSAGGSTRVESAGRLARVSPSSLEGGDARTLREILRPSSSSGRRRGSVLHDLFETVEWIESGVPPRDELVRIALDRGHDGGMVRDAIDAFTSAIAKPEIGGCLSRSSVRLAAGETLELWREKPFAVRLAGPGGEPVLMSGRFDRVVVVRGRDGRATRAILIDFKTDAVEGGRELDERVAHYRPQVGAYCAAIGVMLRLEAGAISARLLFTEAGRAVELKG